MSELVFSPELPLVKAVPLSGLLPTALIAFLPEPAWIKVILTAAQGEPYGMLSGSEGQGSEILFMNDGALGELVLELRPPELVEILDQPFVNALHSEIDSRRTSGRIFLNQWRTEPLVPDLV